MSVRLHQFAYSHFNEKARWALDYKGVDHERETYLPGPHMPAIKKISGRTQTPVLEADGRYVSGSAAIIAYLEAEQPEPNLYPADPALRDAALQAQAHYDDVVGPAVRTVVFSILVQDGGYLCQMFGGSKGLLKRLAYRASFPLARGMIAKGNKADTRENIDAAFALTNKSLDELAASVGPSGYLVGEEFSVADLTAAALTAPIAGVKHPDMRRPEPVPAAFAEMVSQFSDHPAIAWTNEIYARHRA